MKNKKGFTLVELLAVIVVLAIIMIIAVPAVLDSMESAKAGSFKIFAENAIRKTMEKHQTDLLTGSTQDSADKCYKISDLKLETGGKYAGSVKYTASDKSYKAYIGDGTYYVAGKTISDLSNASNILKSGQTGFKATAPDNCQ